MSCLYVKLEFILSFPLLGWFSMSKYPSPSKKSQSYFKSGSFGNITETYMVCVTILT